MKIKDYFEKLIINAVLFTPFILNYFFRHDFYLKTLYYFYFSFIIFLQLSILGSEKILDSFVVGYKIKTKLFRGLCFLIDIAFLLGFVFFDFRILFIMYLFHMLFKMSITIKLIAKVKK